MNINKIKEYLESKKGKSIMITYNGSRNKVEEYEATVDTLYPNIFSVSTKHNNFNEVKTFSYTDVLSNTVELKEM